MKLKNQGKGLGGLLLLSACLAPNVVYAKAASKPVEAKWYVNINRAAMHVNDGYQRDTYFVDNAAESSRAGITGEKRLDNCCNFVGGTAELEFASASTTSVNQLNRTNASTSTDPIGVSSHEGIRIRAVEGWIRNSSWGKLTLGHGAQSSYTVVGKDLSGTTETIGYYSGPYAMAGGMYFHVKDSTTPVTGLAGTPRVINVFNPYDGLGRKDRVRYDSPKFCGFSVTGSISSGEPDNAVVGNQVPTGMATGTVGRRYGSDLALNYDDTLNHAVRLLGGVSMYKVSKGSDEKALKVWDASLAALHLDTGINVAVNLAKKTLPNTSTANSITKKPQFSRVQLGLITDLNCYGSTNFVADFAKSKNSYTDDDKGTAYGVGVVQNLKRVNSQLYVGVRSMKYKQNVTTTTYDRMLAAMAGLKINFGGKLS